MAVRNSDRPVERVVCPCGRYGDVLRSDNVQVTFCPRCGVRCEGRAYKHRGGRRTVVRTYSIGGVLADRAEINRLAERFG